jgi:hypothetical protein
VEWVYFCSNLQKHDKIAYNNYCGISLLPNSYRILSNILISNLSPYLDESIGQHQGWFHRSRSSTDQFYNSSNESTMRQRISCSQTSNKNGFCRLCYRLRAALLCYLSLSYTTCFGLNGHLQVCSILLFPCGWRNLLRWGFCLFPRGHTLHVSICIFILLFFACMFSKQQNKSLKILYCSILLH